VLGSRESSDEATFGELVEGLGPVCRFEETRDEGCVERRTRTVGLGVERLSTGAGGLLVEPGVPPAHVADLPFRL
jgi:hypothetical protein